MYGITHDIFGTIQRIHRRKGGTPHQHRAAGQDSGLQARTPSFGGHRRIRHNVSMWATTDHIRWITESWRFDWTPCALKCSAPALVCSRYLRGGAVFHAASFTQYALGSRHLLCFGCYMHGVREGGNWVKGGGAGGCGGVRLWALTE